MSALADMVGQKLPNSTLNYVGSKPELAGKPLLLEFWATWCPPCRKSIPHLNEIHAKYKDRGLMVVGVTDEPNALIKKFQKEVPMDYAVATDTGGRLNEKMGISGIPHAFLVNRSGEIVWQGHPNRLTDADIEKILE
jgi:thiol-disulfide isomerase/thioredoxin